MKRAYTGFEGVPSRKITSMVSAMSLLEILGTPFYREWSKRLTRHGINARRYLRMMLRRGKYALY